MTDFLTALALVLILALMPERLRWLVDRMSEMPPESLRIGGLVSASLGVFFVWLLRG